MDQIAKEVEIRLKKHFGDNLQIRFHDERNDGRHFALVVISELFAGKTRVERSQIVYGILGDLIGNESIHALRMQCKTPEEI